MAEAEILELISDGKHLTREKGLNLLKRQIDQVDHENLLDSLLDLLTNEVWEKVLGGLLGLSEIMKTCDTSISQVYEKSSLLVFHKEYRVRIAAGVLLGVLVSRENELYSQFQSLLFEEIQNSFTPEINEENPMAAEHVAKGGAGWQRLETAIKCLQQVMAGLGTAFQPFADDTFFNVLDMAIHHSNRFVREIGHFVNGDLCTVSSYEYISEISDLVVDILQQGLRDNWSQVRYAASASLRGFLTKMGTYAEKYHSILIPKMCLNRYYVAEGVKLYSIETWKQYCGTRGPELVIENIATIVEFYIGEVRADNHAVREAACLCIGELGSKVAAISNGALESHVANLLDALIDGFKDESWPVRDAACLACGDFVAAYPEQSKPRLEELKQLWIAHLSDNISSVREHSSLSVAKAAKAYRGTEQDFSQELVDYMSNNILKAKDQPAFEASHDKTHLHDDVRYSCGSLAPKMKRGGGCMDHGFLRDKQPWEYTEGVVFLAKDLAAIDFALIQPLAEQLCDVCRMEVNENLKQTFWRNFAALGIGAGKQPFKQILELFIPYMFRDLQHHNRSIAFAVQDCILAISDFIGENIFKGRVEMVNPDLVPVLQGLKK